MSPASLGTFSAVLLAGGRSSRMGSDKADLVIDGEPLWRRQLAKLRATGADEVFISGRPLKSYEAETIRVVEDKVPGCGPLGAIESSLGAASNPWLLVLAVDLIDLPAEFLAAMAEEAMREQVGLVPMRGEWFQPLAAIYPRECAPIAAKLLAGGERRMRSFVNEATEAGLVRPYPIDAETEQRFTNLNSPDDLRRRAP